MGKRTSPTGPYEFVTYAEVNDRMLAFGAGLADIGLEPGQNSILGIYSMNCIEVSVCALR